MFKGSGFIAGGRLFGKLGAMEGVLALLYAILGTYAFVNFCKLIAKVKFLSFIFEWFGNHSMYFLILHQMIVFIFKDIVGYSTTNRLSTSEVTEPITFLFLGVSILLITLYIIVLGAIKKKIKENKLAKENG